MFKKVYLEISNICNVQCSFCPVVEKDNKLMDVAEFESVLKEVAPLAETVCLHLLGEPLAHPKFSEILDVCERYNTQIDLTTNGILIKRYSERIINSPSVRQVNFSIQAFKDNFPDRDLDPFLLPIFEFTKSAQALRPALYVNYRLWNQQSNDSDNEDIFLKMMFKIGLNGDAENLIPIDHFGDGFISMFVMAVIQAIAESSGDDKCLFLFEEPESFLHPSAQAEFGMLLRDLAKEFEVQVTPHYMNKPDNQIASICFFLLPDELVSSVCVAVGLVNGCFYLITVDGRVLYVYCGF